MVNFSNLFHFPKYTTSDLYVMVRTSNRSHIHFCHNFQSSYEYLVHCQNEDPYVTSLQKSGKTKFMIYM